ncbi:MAG TPA: ATP-binding protein, partial [Labilithrix sp.]|nr:ATP-binding protein [Labilithrix sp.]
RANGMELEARVVHLRSRLGLYSFCIGVAPTLYMAALVTTVREHPLRITHLFATNALFVAAIAIFACLSAVLLASTITRPVSEMAEVMHALTSQGDVSRVSRLPVPHRDEIGELAELTNRMLDRLEIIAKERMNAVASLSALNETLEKRVEERTAELELRGNEMRLVLDNVGDGLVVIDPSGQMPALLSKALVDWFGTPEPGELFYRFLGRRAPAFTTEAELGWGQVLDGILPLEVTLAQMPRRLECDGRQYQVSYDPIANDPSGRILVVVADETTRIEREAAEHEKREMMAILDHLLGERGVFLDFMDEASDIVASLRPAEAETADTRRALHTLKGNTLFFGLESIAGLCHAIETALAEGLSTRFLFTKLSERWERLDEQVSRIVGEKQRRMVEIAHEDYERLEGAIRTEAPRAHVAELLHLLKLEPVSMRLDHLAEQARRIGKRLQKKARIEVIHDGLRLDAGWSKLWSALVHPVRNALDHGIETPDEREYASKSREGRIILRAERRGSGIVVEIEDDGRGIAWNAIATSCVSRGLPAATQDDLVAALFTDGFSTAASVTDISGRGVGMGALRSAVLALDGVLEVSSEPGRGTRLRMTFPLPGTSSVAAAARSHAGSRH